jgi:hypothetical protein
MTARILALGCAVAASTLSLAASATAGQAVLWACHGPAGQALGGQPLTAATFGDGVITTYGSGCAAPTSAIGDGGVRASFTRVDPAGGSQAFWRLDVPSSVTLRSARLARRTSGFGGTPVPGAGQSYATQTSAGAIESARVEDGSNVPLDGVLDASPVSGIYTRFGVLCEKAPLERCAPATAAELGVDASSIALSVSDAAAPRGAVGGVFSPAAGTLGLSLFATDDGLGLASARATLDGALAAVVDLGGAACAELSPQDATIDLAAGGGCPSSVTGAELDVDTSGVPDGVHELRVVVRDAAGNESPVADEQIVVRNAPAQTSSQATLSLGTGGPGSGGDSGAGAARGGDGGGTVAPGRPATAGPACAQPRLSMLLRSRPLRTFRGIPVLSRLLAYRYSGSLTCLVAGRRASAPAGTVVEILSVTSKGAKSEGGITTKKRGALSVLLRFATSRIVRFRHRSTDGTTARVSIRIAVAHPVVRRR